MSLKEMKVPQLMVWIICLLFLSCTDIGITMPKGPKGDTGASAYEFWKESVWNGTIDWPKNQTEVVDFFLYLKGKDGKDGKDGLNGKGAYEQWKEWIAKGEVENPHDPSKRWSENDNTIHDFWKFLTGATGENGQTPHVGVNGNWFIGNMDTGIAARGRDGIDAIPPKVTIGSNGNWFVDGADTGVLAQGRDGRDGVDGRDGADAVPPVITIEADGNWYIDGVNTGVSAVGKDGKDGKNGKDAVTPAIMIGSNGNWYINGEDTGVLAKGRDGADGRDGTDGHDGVDGRDGATPVITIGENGHWFVNGEDTGKKAVGADGKAPEVAIGENGNWYIDGKDTGVRAYGRDGADGRDGVDGTNGADGTNGTNGKSAYELWKEYISSGTVDDPHNEGMKWPATKNQLSDFWEFLTGKASTITIEMGKYNVIPLYWNADLREYVNPADGSVLFAVYDKEAKLVGSGVRVSGLPGVVSATTGTGSSNVMVSRSVETETFITDENGQFKVPAAKLPDNLPLSNRRGSVVVSVDGVHEMSAANALVPNRVNVRCVINSANLNGNTAPDYRYLYLTFKYERQIDGEWEAYPSVITVPSKVMTAKVKDIHLPVTEENLEKDKLTAWSSGTTYAYIVRPIVLTETEKAYTDKNDSIARNKKYEWDKAENYIAVYFGDGVGTTNDYGQVAYMPDKFYLPEVYPAPGFKENSVYYDIKEGITSLWGEMDVDNTPDFYAAAYEGTYSYVKDGTTNIWTVPGGKKTWNQLGSRMACVIQMRTMIAGTGGTVVTGTKELSKGGRRFVLNSAYPDNWILVDICPRNSSSNGIVTFSTNYTYRGRYAYVLEKVGETYYLVDFSDRTKKWPLERKACPADWMQ